MEPVSLIISVVSLVGVFKDCMDLFSMISATKSLGTDFEILNAKLDVDKILLLQWAQRVRLLQPDYDERLDDWRTSRAVSAALCALRSLLSRTDNLQKRYGLRLDREIDITASDAISTLGKGTRPALLGTTRAPVEPEIPPIGPRMEQLLGDFDAFNQRLKFTQKQSSLKNRLMWVVKSREDFSLWIQQISDFVGKLNALIPPLQDSDAAVARLVQSLEKTKSIGAIKPVLHAAKQIDATAVDPAHKHIEEMKLEAFEECQSRILDCLRVSATNDRIRSIPAAHKKTLRWVLDTTALSAEIQGDSIAEWLESGTGVYWVCGKAGSGKSTLMKHLFWELKETDRLLETWAGSKELITAAFFFWHLGTPEQKTKDGLFRSLLYTILAADPSLIPHLLPGMWQDAYDVVTWKERKVEQNIFLGERRQQHYDYVSGESSKDFPVIREEEEEYVGVEEMNKLVEKAGSDGQPARRIRRVGRRVLTHGARPTLEVPSTREMGEAFQRLKKKQTRHKFCFFIDGLDEYTGDHLSGTDIIMSLASNDEQGDSENVKIIVSSRPIPICVQAFSRKKKLQLQDITGGDIAAYVDDTIRSHEYIEKIIAMDEPCVRGILCDLVNKASGVFLWVVLACRSLLEGFAAYNFPGELRRRVDELPPELELLFKQMLEKMDKRYRHPAAKLVRVCYQARLNEDARRRAWALDSTAARWTKIGAEDETVLGLPTLGLALLDEYGFDLAQLPDPRALSENEISAKCKIFDARLRSRCCGLLETRRLENFADSTVEFMHPSVFDFLSSEGVLDLPCLQVDDGPSRFEPNAVLSRMYLHAMPMVPTPARLQICASGSLVSTRSSTAGIQAGLGMLQQFARIALEMARKDSAGDLTLAFFKQIKEHFPKPSRESETTLALLLAAELGMTETILKYTAQAPEPTQTPLLYHAVGRPYTRCLPIWRLPVPPEMIKFLLSEQPRVFSPNETFDSSGENLTPWACWLRHMHQSEGDAEPASTFEEITRLFIEMGADVTARLPEGVSHTSVESLIRWRILEARPEGQKVELLESMHVHPLAERFDEILRMIKAKSRDIQSQPQASSSIGQCTVS